MGDSSRGPFERVDERYGAGGVLLLTVLIAAGGTAIFFAAYGIPSTDPWWWGYAQVVGCFVLIFVLVLYQIAHPSIL